MLCAGRDRVAWGDRSKPPPHPARWPEIASHHQSLDLGHQAPGTRPHGPAARSSPARGPVAAAGPSHTDLPCGPCDLRREWAELLVPTTVPGGFTSLCTRGQVPCPSVATRTLWPVWHLGPWAGGFF